MKNIKFNHDRLFKAISKILVSSLAFTFFAHCPFNFFEPTNPKLKKLK
ncbi:hypothetical protein DTPHA_1406385 [Enterococcus faecium]|nr:hypothetical protein DTPHA_1406385 [Enterococcus faecium]